MQDAKTYVCCDLTTALHNVWVPWTVAGSLALVLSVFASVRVVTSTLHPHGQTGRSGGGIEGGIQVAGRTSSRGNYSVKPEGDLVPAVPGAPAAGQLPGSQHHPALTDFQKADI